MHFFQCLSDRLMAHRLTHGQGHSLAGQEP
jgi:hypothetical protein